MCHEQSSTALTYSLQTLLGETISLLAEVGVYRMGCINFDTKFGITAFFTLFNILKTKPLRFGS